MFHARTASISLLIFVTGFLTGQQYKHSKFDKYLRPTTATAMDIAMIQANLNLISDGASSGVDGIELPKIYFDPSCGCISATAIVHPDLMKRSIDELRGKLTAIVITTRMTVKEWIPELIEGSSVDPDFKMRFRTLRGTAYEVFAEYINGKIVFK